MGRGHFSLGFSAFCGAVGWDFDRSWLAECHLSALVVVLSHVCDNVFHQLLVLLGLNSRRLSGGSPHCGPEAFSGQALLPS